MCFVIKFTNYETYNDHKEGNNLELNQLIEKKTFFFIFDTEFTISIKF